MVNLKTDENPISAVVIATGLSLCVFYFNVLRGRHRSIKKLDRSGIGDGTPIKSQILTVLSVCCNRVLLSPL